MSWIVVVLGVALIAFALVPFLFLPPSASLPERCHGADRGSDVPTGHRRN